MFRVAVALVVSLSIALHAPAQELKPLGAWFSGYERLTFDDEIAWGHAAYAVSHYADAEFYTPFRTVDLPQYSAVFFGQRGGRALAKDEQSTLQKWVEAGGHLVLSGEEGQRLFGNEPPAWLGIVRWQSGKPIKCAIQQADHELAKGLGTIPDSDPAWQTGTTVAPRDGAVSVIGKDGQSLLLAATHGKGKIVYLGGALTPQARPAYREKQFVHDLSPLARAVWSNLFAFLGTPRRSDAIRQGMAGHDGPIRFWWRYLRATPLGARLHSPPYPKREDELAELALDMGKGERLRRPFFVTSLREQTVSVRVTDLAGAERAVIPAASCQVFVQERPVAGYDKAGYWLVPVNAPISLRANESSTFWIILRTPNAKPGVYRGAVEFRDGERVTSKLPLSVKVWDVRCPGSDLLHFELEHIWFTMPGGYWIEKDRSRQATIALDGKSLVSTPMNDPRVLGNYIRALGELEVDYAQNWSDVERLYTLAFLRLRKDGKLLTEEIDRNPQQFREGPLPALDFSDGYDHVWNMAIPAGMRALAMNYSVTGDGTLGLARRIAKDDKLSADSPLAKRVREWYWGEYVKYLRERGLRGLHTKIHDEFGPSGVPSFIESAKAIRPSGIKTYTTTYNFDRDPKAVAAIAPHLDLWQMAWPRANPFGADRETWGTTASSFWGNGEGARAAGWLAARLGYRGVHTHGYMRWFWNDHEGCFPGPDGPFNSVAVTNTAQGIADGRYLAQLIRLIDLARRAGKREVADEVEREWKTAILGVEQSCLLRLRHQPRMTGIDATWWPIPGTSLAAYDAAKRKVLELTIRVAKALGPASRGVAFSDFPLVRSGKAVCRVEKSLLTESVPELANPEQQRSLASDAPVILTGTLQGHAELREYVVRHLPEEITERYPRQGRYAIRILPAAGKEPRTLLIVGGDQEGVDTGLRNLIHLLTVEDQW